MKLLLLLLAIVLPGCGWYVENATSFNEQGLRKHTMTVLHFSLLQNEEAARLQTETHTEEFIRSVNAENISSATDSVAAEAMIRGFAKGLKP